MRVLGIDPGTYRIGFAVVEAEGGKLNALHHETLVLQSRRTQFTLAHRLKRIFDSLTEVCKIYQPDAAALEDVFYGHNFATAVRIGEARAVAMLAATNFNVEVAEYLPTRIKQAVTGNGQASKVQMQYMVKQLLRLRENPPQDAADALAVAICHCHLNQRQYV